MKHCVLTIVCLVICHSIFGQNFKQQFVSTDIGNFWNAYDSILNTSDTLIQEKYLKKLYLEKGTIGLKSLIQVRNYTSREFLSFINSSPKFWNSIRANTLSVKKYFPEIEADIQKLKVQYPDLKPVPIYFAIGAFRTNGTVHQNKILIGAELALADDATITDELPEWRKPFYEEYKSPIKGLALLCTHEYIHTQQKELVHNLLSYCLYEGIAEFVSCKVTGKPSNSPAIEFGKANQDAVVRQFVKDLFTGENINNWLWGENRNDLKVRDLGYYIGYEIAERYYDLSLYPKQAIKNLIELEYSNEAEVEKIVNSSFLLPESLDKLYAAYEKERPEVVSVKPFKKGSQDVDPQISQLTIEFSEPMNDCCRGFDFGNLGESHAVKINSVKGWSEDKKQLTVEIDPLKPGWNYQLLLENFRSMKGFRSKAFLIEFKTL